MSEDLKLTVYVTREGDSYVAQCIERDICAQAPDMETLITRMSALIDLECEEGMARTGKPFGDLPPAPAFFHDMADRVRNSLRSDGLEFKIAA